MQSHLDAKARHIAKCLELAILFEVSADKPGNVNLVTGFEGTRYEHFLASAVACASHFESAAIQGVRVSRGECNVDAARLGRTIRNCVADINYWQKGGNTLLGTVILLSPIAVAAGMTSTREELLFGILDVRRNLKFVVESTTPEDAVQVYEAIRTANPSGLGKVPELDINDPGSVDRILEDHVTLYDVFTMSSTRDNVCSEWVRNYPITFEVAYRHLKERIENAANLNEAVVHTFLKVLSEYPDTFIARKVGTERAREVSIMAGAVLESGGLVTPKGRKELRQFDLHLRRSDNYLNPGTTADIIAAALSLVILEGYRP